MAPPDSNPSEHAHGINAAVAAELRAERAARGMTNQDIADRSGISKVSVQRYLAPTRAIDVAHLELLAAAVGCTAREIVQRAEERRLRESPPLAAEDRADIDAAKSRIRRNQAKKPVVGPTRSGPGSAGSKRDAVG